MILELFIIGIAMGCIYALATLGFNIIFKVTKALNFSQGMMAALATYLVLFYSAMLPTGWGVILGLITMGFLALLIEFVILRRFIGEPILSVIIATVGLIGIVKGLIYLIYGPTFIPLAPIITGELTLGGIKLYPELLIAMIVAPACMGTLAFFFKKTILGSALYAVSEDQQAALGMGISVKRSIAISWLLGLVLAGISGILIASLRRGVSLEIEGIIFIVLAASILGGLDSMVGAFIGSLVMSLVERFSTFYLDGILGLGFGSLSPLLVALGVMIIRPYGLLGSERIERV